MSSKFPTFLFYVAGACSVGALKGAIGQILNPTNSITFETD